MARGEVWGFRLGGSIPLFSRLMGILQRKERGVGENIWRWVKGGGERGQEKKI